jgi:hypothetical protein
MRIPRTLATLVVSSVAAATFAVTTPGTAFANDNITTTTEVTAALDKADARNGALVATAAPSTTDGDSAAQTAAVDIPADPTKGIKLTDDGQTITIGLPNASQGGKGAKNGKGVVAYSGRDGSANAVVPADNGGVQFLTVIESKKAPTKYDYPVTLPKGGKIVLLDGGAAAIVYDAQNQPLVAVAAPWAKDANGNDVRTYFTTNGQKLTQHVAHKVKGVAYPVVADPLWLPGWAIWWLIRCGVFGSAAWVMSGGFDWYWRLIAVVGSCR